MEQSRLGRLSSVMRSCCSYSTLKTWLPILSWLPRYRLKWLQMDLLAGLTVGLTAIPQALAYAEVAGLPVQYGLYSAFMGGFIYTFLGTSKDVTIGPTAIMSLLCFSVVGGQPHRAALLTLLSGLIQTVMALLRLGFLLDFISYPVIKGFTCASAITIAVSQVKNILGLRGIPHQFFLAVYYTFSRIPEARIGDVVLGLICLALLVSLMVMKMYINSDDPPPSLCSKVSRKFVWSVATMRNALVVLAASAVAYSLDSRGYHVFTVTGETPSGLPPFQPPPTTDTTANGTVVSFVEIVKGFGEGLAVIPLMGLLESIAIAKAFASQNNYRINVNQELLAIGVTNTLGSFVSAYPVTGSFGRTAVNSQTGVCTPAGGVITGTIVLVSLRFLMPILYYIPKASLGAVIICAVTPMCDLRILAKMWRISKLDLLPFGVTFLLSFWEVQYGIIGGVATSGALLLYNMARPQIKVSDHGMLVIELGSGLSFPATEYLSNLIHTQALQVCPPRSVVLDCRHVSVIDYSVVSELRDLLRQFKLQDQELVFSGLRPSVLVVLLAADLQGIKYSDSVEAALQRQNFLND
ncbi:sodium-independent sulfate anion transporter isoform X2 [Antennarius striatus]|uniref:sodium-independent sulfate anion transporter isoform X2 n=1 Tax=Antennarius striatus TaxID=241820 RepID=UPI0035B1FC1C